MPRRVSYVQLALFRQSLVGSFVALVLLAGSLTPREQAVSFVSQALTHNQTVNPHAPTVRLANIRAQVVLHHAPCVQLAPYHQPWASLLALVVHWGSFPMRTELIVWPVNQALI